MRRYETRSTMMTSNRPLEDWGKLIGDVPSATAILDRFLHHAEIVTINGKSYRLRNQAATDKLLPHEADRDGSKPANAPIGSSPESTDSNPANAPIGSKLSKRRKSEPEALATAATSSESACEPAKTGA